jgi:membrane protein DedA with SNARE-associated domain
MLDTIVETIQQSDPLLVCLVVALILLLEGSGVPVANTTVLLLAGAMAPLIGLPFVVLACAAVGGSVTGCCISYVIGDRGGRRVLLRIMAFFRMKQDKALIVERWFAKAGIWMIFFSRLIPWIRPWACIPAGIARMPFLPFFLAALSGATIWCVTFLAIGWNLGQRWEEALQFVQHYLFPAIGALVLLCSAFGCGMLLVRRYLARKYQTTAEVPVEEHAPLEV